MLEMTFFSASDCLTAASLFREGHRASASFLTPSRVVCIHPSYPEFSWEAAASSIIFLLFSFCHGLAAVQVDYTWTLFFAAPEPPPSSDQQAEIDHPSILWYG